MAFCEGAEADMHMYFDKAGKYVCCYSRIVLRFNRTLATDNLFWTLNYMTFLLCLMSRVYPLLHYVVSEIWNLCILLKQVYNIYVM